MQGISFIKDFFPSDVTAITSTRLNGFSTKDFASFNLGLNTGDSSETVKKNREILENLIRTKVIWMNQFHSSVVELVNRDKETFNSDGIYTTEKNLGCAVLTADCIPILVSSSDSRIIGTAHAGWRGLSIGIIENFFSKFLDAYFKNKGHSENSASINIWLGPAICKNCFSVGNNVRLIFLKNDITTKKYFSMISKEKWLCDLKGIVKKKIQDIFDKVNLIPFVLCDDDNCTYENNKLFYSYRRDFKTGRMASVIVRK